MNPKILYKNPEKGTLNLNPKLQTIIVPRVLGLWGFGPRALGLSLGYLQVGVKVYRVDRPYRVEEA